MFNTKVWAASPTHKSVVASIEFGFMATPEVGGRTAMDSSNAHTPLTPAALHVITSGPGTRNRGDKHRGGRETFMPSKIGIGRRVECPEYTYLHI